MVWGVGGWRVRSLITVLAPLILLSGCTCKVPVTAASGLVQLSERVNLYRRPLEIRLSKPASPTKNGVLVVYATGDGGWHGLGEEIYRWISAWDYPMAGFSSRGYLKNLSSVSDTATTTPRRLSRDFETIIDFAERALELPKETPIILVGVSRGAGLAVVAAGQGELKGRLAGVVAIALTKEEEHVVRYRTRAGSSPAGSPGREMVEIKTYDYLPRLAGLPIMVIQSSNDGYLPAAKARTLFGPDTELGKLRAVPAKNHSFRGGCATLYKYTEDSLVWIRGFLTRTHGAFTPGSRPDAPSVGSPD